jgi:60 kDa SS-A/Ro ribonucleoprotein
MDNMPFGSTDCSLPMQYALQRKIMVDVFIVLTDNETYFGSIHPSQALEKYRREVNPGAKLCVCAFAVSGLSGSERA